MIKSCDGFLCKNGVLRDFLGSGREGPTFNIESVLRGAVGN